MMKEELLSQIANKPWFHSLGKDEFDRPVVYVKHLCQEAINIPDTLNEKQLLVHLSGYLEASKEKYISSLQLSKAEFDPDFMRKEIFALKRQCGSDNLIDILYEVHQDLSPSICPEEVLTEISEDFPEVRFRLERLYEQYGMDVLFEEIER